MSVLAIVVVVLLIGGVISVVVGAALMDVTDTAAFLLTRGGVAAVGVGLAVAVAKVVTS